MAKKKDKIVTLHPERVAQARAKQKRDAASEERRSEIRKIFEEAGVTGRHVPNKKLWWIGVAAVALVAIAIGYFLPRGGVPTNNAAIFYSADKKSESAQIVNPGTISKSDSLLSQFDGIAVKRLSKTDASGNRFWGVRKLKELLGKEDGTFKTQFLYFGNNGAFSDKGIVTWSDIRKHDPSRSEHVLDYESNIVTDKARQGDTMIVGKRNNTLFIIITGQQSIAEHELLGKLGIDNDIVQNVPMQIVDAPEDKKQPAKSAEAIILEKLSE